MDPQHENAGPEAAGAKGKAERRRAKRSVLHMRAHVTLPGDLTLVSHTVDISAGGVSCLVPYPLDVSQQCTIEFDLKRFGSGRVESIAIVKSCRLTEQGKYQAGLEFKDPPSELTETLKERLVHSAIAAQK